MEVWYSRTMDVYLTRHARNRMRLYDITVEEVQRVLANPERVLGGAFERQHAWKRRAHGSWLRVTFKDEGTRRVVITVTPKRHLAGGPHAY